MNKGIILALSDVESCNYTPHKKNHTEASNSENLYFAGRVSRDANPWPTPKIWGFLLVLAVCPNVLTKYGLRPAVRQIVF
jgi:hypothetical protein